MMLELCVRRGTGLLQKCLSVALLVGIADLLLCGAHPLPHYLGVNKR